MSTRVLERQILQLLTTIGAAARSRFEKPNLDTCQNNALLGNVSNDLLPVPSSHRLAPHPCDARIECIESDGHDSGSSRVESSPSASRIPGSTTRSSFEFVSEVSEARIFQGDIDMCGPPLMSPPKPPSRVGVGRYSEVTNARAGRWRTLASLQTQTRRQDTSVSRDSAKDASNGEIWESEIVTGADRNDGRSDTTDATHSTATAVPTTTPPLDPEAVTWAKRVQMSWSNRYVNSAEKGKEKDVVLESFAGSAENATVAIGSDESRTIAPTLSTSPFLMRDGHMHEHNTRTVDVTMTNEGREEELVDESVSKGSSDENIIKEINQQNDAPSLAPVKLRFDSFESVDDVVTCDGYTSELDVTRNENSWDALGLSNVTLEMDRGEDSDVPESASPDASIETRDPPVERGTSYDTSADVPYGNVSYNDAYMSDASYDAGSGYLLDSGVCSTPNSPLGDGIFSPRYSLSVSPKAVRSAIAAVTLFDEQRNVEAAEARARNASAFIALRKSLETNSPPHPPPIKVWVEKRSRKKADETDAPNARRSLSSETQNKIHEKPLVRSEESWEAEKQWPPLPAVEPEEHSFVEEEETFVPMTTVVAASERKETEPATTSSRVWAAIVAEQDGETNVSATDLNSKLSASDVAESNYTLMLARVGTLDMFAGEVDEEMRNMDGDVALFEAEQKSQNKTSPRDEKEKENLNPNVSYKVSGDVPESDSDPVERFRSSLLVLEDAVRAALGARAALASTSAPGTLLELDAKLAALGSCLATAVDAPGEAKQSLVSQQEQHSRDTQQPPGQPPTFSPFITEECFPPGTHGAIGVIESEAMERAMAKVVEKCLASFADGVRQD